jgi:hypothetical protein
MGPRAGLEDEEKKKISSVLIIKLDVQHFTRRYID